jgi:hypothetical protein
VVVDLLNDEFVPVWINIRTTPVPDIACLEDVLGKVTVGADGMVQGAFSQGFFVRSVVLGPDGETLLNPQDAKNASLGDLFGVGYFPYAQVKPKDYLPMLRVALARSRAANPN